MRRWQGLRDDPQRATRVRQRAAALTAVGLFFGGLLTAVGAGVLVLVIFAAIAGVGLLGAIAWLIDRHGLKHLRRPTRVSAGTRVIRPDWAAIRVQAKLLATHLRLLIVQIARDTAPAYAAARERARALPRALSKLEDGVVSTRADWQGWPYAGSAEAAAATEPRSAERMPEERQQALELNARAGQLRRDGEIRAAITQHAQALEIFRELGDQRAEASTLNSLALSLEVAGEMAAAVEHFEGSLAILRELDDDRHEGRVIANLGFTLLKHGDEDRARELLAKALDKLEPESPAARQVEQQLRRAS